MRTAPWFPRELLPGRGTWVWHARDALFAGVTVAIGLILFWRPPTFVLVLVPASAALLVGMCEFTQSRKAISAWRAKQNAYYKSATWQARRLQILHRDSCTCQRCGARADDVHHLSYSADHDEPDDQLVSLCRECHEETHGRSLGSSDS